MQRCYIRSGVNEKGEIYLASVFYGGAPINHTGIKVSTKDGQFAETAAIPYDGGVNYRFKDLGKTTEVVTYKGEKGLDAAKFISTNVKERVKAEYTGGKPYTLYIADGDKKLHGFAMPGAVLTGVETRSSSPVRLPRDENFESPVKGLYPCGEGAGYAGGIVSAAADGLKAAFSSRR